MEGTSPRPEPTDTATPAQAPHATVDKDNPWLGLASFTEETRQYFYGREEEVAELCRRVQRKLLTTLFGQSGLGKTSILRAGVVPRLRPEGYCPVYVRIDYGRDAPTPAEQIKQAIFQATHAAGAWTQPGTAVEGESLWEFLHHRDDVLRDASGKPLVPLLIFDQFEEIFTLAQTDDRGRQRAAQFLDDLADLVENRPPRALEARLEADDSSVEQFDFSRADYRILIALREDYLAHLEGVKGIMPSITQNRMRLARMTGQQALSAVLKPGGRLVSEEVAAAIVRFTAGGSELPNAEVEPALLSLICRELNNARIAQGRAEITSDLLAGLHDNILAEFYERALVDQPLDVRRIIEDQLLTESGFRESLAEERVRKLFAAAGAKPDALETLVDRRLLRIEERLDVRRVELTHDVLCSVVRASRDQRLAREARELAERQLALQQERERATRKALVRARQIATVCGVLAFVAAAGAFFGYVSMRRAQEAEFRAEQTRVMAERARSESEKLIVYLLDDFYRELEPVGRLDIVAELARRALDYYHELPPELRTPETERNRALALVRYGAVLRYQSKVEESDKALTEAVTTLTRMAEQGDHSEMTTIGLALGLAAKARLATSLNDFVGAARLGSQAADALALPMRAPSPSLALQRTYGAVMTQLGFVQLRSGREEEAVQSFETARATFRGIDGLKLGDLPSAADYTEASSWEVDALQSVGRRDEARRVGEEAAVVAGRILDKQPGHMPALRARALITSALSSTEDDSLNLRKALVYAQAAERDWDSFLRIDPGNAIAQNNLLAVGSQIFGLYWRMGRIDEALAKGRALVDSQRQGETSAMLAGNVGFTAWFLAILENDLGNRRQADAALAASRRLIERAVRDLPPDSFGRTTGVARVEIVNVARLTADDDEQEVKSAAQARFQRIEALKPANAGQERTRNFLLLNIERQLAVAAYRLGQYDNAEVEIRKAMRYQRLAPPRTLADERDQSDDQMLLALCLARLGRHEEARQAAEPALRFHRQLQSRGNDDLTQRIQLAQALYATAVASNGRGYAALREAAAYIDGLPQPMRALKSTTTLRRWISEELRRS